MTPTIVVCTQCEEPVDLPYWMPYCSKRCRRMAKDEGTLPPVAAYSPMEWDGRTRYSGVPERVYMYTAKCQMCGREQGDLVYITHHAAALMERAGLPRCTACRGWVLMDCLDMGAIGSPHIAVPVRSHAVGGTRSDGRKTL